MFSHITVGTNDMDAARRFYDALFAAMGARPGVFDEKGRLLYFKDGRMFGVTAPIDGQPACHANGGTIGFTLDSAEAVRGWQDAGVAHGGTAIEDRLASAAWPGASCSWPTCATRTATSCARCMWCM